MIKTFLLAGSLMLNCLFIGKRVYFSYNKAPNGYEYIEKAITSKTSIQDLLPIDSGDIVFAGNSLTESFPLTEYFSMFKVKNRGVSSRLTRHLAKAMPAIANSKPSKIFIEIGINDLAHNQSQDSIMINYQSIIYIIKSMSPSTKIYVQSLLPTCEDSDYLNKDIVQINSLLQALCKLNNIQYIDLYSLYAINGRMPENLTYDGIHLNGAGYRIWQTALGEYMN